MYHDEDKLSFNITNATIEMTTSLSKKPQCGKEWCYKGISHIIIKYCGPIAEPDDGGTIYFEPTYNHHVWFDNDKYGQWGIMFSKVYIITLHQKCEYRGYQRLWHQRGGRKHLFPIRGKDDG